MLRKVVNKRIERDERRLIGYERASPLYRSLNENLQIVSMHQKEI